MKRFTFLWTGVIMLVIMLGSTVGQAQEKEKPKQAMGPLKIVIDPLPSALDTLYPPKAKPTRLGAGYAWNGHVFFRHCHRPV